MLLFSLLMKKRVWVREIHPGLLALWVGGVFALHVVAMIVLEKFTPFESIWMTATTIVTVGFGDFFPKTTLGRLATMGLFAAGIFTLAATVNEIQEAQATRRERKRSGQWKWKMKDHIVFVSPKTGQHEDFVADVVQELRSSGCQQHVMLLSLGEQVGLPSRFEALDIAIVRASKMDADAMAAACLADSHTTILLDDDDPRSGSAFVVDTLSRFEGHSASHFVVEAQGEDEERLKRLGAERVVRPFRVYPELLAREIVAPHSASLVQDLFSAAGTTLVRLDFKSEVFERWDNLVLRLMRSGHGTAIAYLDREGKLVCNPWFDSKVFIKSLYVIAGDPKRTVAHAERIFEIVTRFDDH